MKTADIKVGEFYAFGRDYEYHHDRAQKSEILAVGVEFPRRYGRNAYKGIQVRITRPDQTTYTTVVRPQEIREPWDGYAEKVQQHRESRRAAAEARKRNAALVTDRIQAILPDAPVPEPARFGDGFTSPSIRTWEQVADLLEQAYAAGVAAGTPEWKGSPR